jgi:hypothetical protein
MTATRMLELETALMLLVAKHGWADGRDWPYACDVTGIAYFENYAQQQPQTNAVLEHLHEQIKTEVAEADLGRSEGEAAVVGSERHEDQIRAERNRSDDGLQKPGRVANVPV